jgi:hypothetical protein
MEQYLGFFYRHTALVKPLLNTLCRHAGVPVKGGKVLYSVVWIFNEANCKLMLNQPPFQMNNLALSVERLNSLIVKFKFFEALDEFYDESIVSFENEGNPTIGLENYRLAAKKYLDNISNSSASLKNVIVSDNMSVCEWHYKFDHREWGHWDKIQLSVQRWKNGKIIHERHHYN